MSAPPRPRRRFGRIENLQLLQQMSADSPFSAPWGTMGAAWERIAAKLNASPDFNIQTSGKSCQARFHALLFKHRQMQRNSAGYPDTFVPSTEKEQAALTQFRLLEALEAQMRDAERTKPGRLTVNRHPPLKNGSASPDETEEDELAIMDAETEDDPDPSEQQENHGLSMKRRLRPRRSNSGSNTSSSKRYKRDDSDTSVSSQEIADLFQGLLDRQAENMAAFREMLETQQKQSQMYRREESERRQQERLADQMEREQVRQEAREQRQKDREAETERFQALLEAFVQKK